MKSFHANMSGQVIAGLVIPAAIWIAPPAPAVIAQPAASFTWLVKYMA